MTNEQRASSEDNEHNMVVFVRQYILQVITIQNELMRRLLDGEPEVAFELAEVFEDAANTYLDLSEMISDRYRPRSKFTLETD